MTVAEAPRATAQRHWRVERRGPAEPFFSVCIPQYNRTSFLLETLRSFRNQSVRNFEVCISDDLSPDNRQAEIIEFLEAGDFDFCFAQREINGRYDANLRSAISLARGRYCFLMGNDDATANATTLAELQRDIELAGHPAVCVTNFADFATAKPHRRVLGDGVRGSGPSVAVKQFRNFSFVSGVILDRRRAQAHETAAWDGSEMYQTFIASRILGEGGAFLGVDRVAVRKDIAIPGETVDAYSRWKRLDPCPLVERKLPLCKLGQVVAAAIAPYGDSRSQRHWNARIVAQLLCFTLPFWIFEYRRVQSWKYAAGVCLGMRVRNLAAGMPLGAFSRFGLCLVHVAVSVIGLAVPIRCFDLLKRPLYALAKSRR